MLDHDGGRIEDEVVAARSRLVFESHKRHALVFENALFQGSPANVTDEIRLIVGALAVPAEATPVLFYETARHEVAVCEADEKFYLTHSPTLTKSSHVLEERQIPATD